MNLKNWHEAKFNRFFKNYEMVKIIYKFILKDGLKIKAERIFIKQFLDHETHFMLYKETKKFKIFKKRKIIKHYVHTGFYAWSIKYEGKQYY